MYFISKIGSYIITEVYFHLFMLINIYKSFLKRKLYFLFNFLNIYACVKCFFIISKISKLKKKKKENFNKLQIKLNYFCLYILFSYVNCANCVVRLFILLKPINLVE